MKIESIKELMEAFDNSKIHRMNLSSDEFNLRLEKEHIVTGISPVLAQTTPRAPVSAINTQASVKEVFEEEIAPEGFIVKSPIVGTFYRASAPDAPPFVNIGQRVEEGEILCIVEAMKMMNEIKAPVSGVIKKINVNDGALLEYETSIMEIEED